MLSDGVLSHLRAVIDAPDLSGTRYELIEEIGRGGMGVVYLAHDGMLGRNVALKIVDSVEEARTLASLEHPGIVPVHDEGALPDGRAYYAYEIRPRRTSG
jgi:eukaryotic-like serine/threonine-protein kinase